MASVNVFAQQTADLRNTGSSGSFSWAQIIAGTGGSPSLNAANAADSTLWLVGLDSGTWYLDRTYLEFDTSVLGAGAVVTAIKLNIYLLNKNGSSGKSFTVVKGTGSGSYSGADWSAFTGAGLNVGAVEMDDLNLGAYTQVDINSADGRAAVNPTGLTRMVLRNIEYDSSGGDPTGVFIFPDFSGAIAGSGQPGIPYLEIVYTPGAGSAAAQRRSAAGVRAGSRMAI